MQRLRRRLLGRLGGVVLVGKLWRFAWRGAPEQNAELLTYRPRPHARGVRTAKFSGRNLAVRKPEGDFGPAASGLKTGSDCRARSAPSLDRVRRQEADGGVFEERPEFGPQQRPLTADLFRAVDLAHGRDRPVGRGPGRSTSSLGLSAGKH
jgi:hypothetical protein